MKGKKLITAYVFAQIDFIENKTGYGVCTRYSINRGNLGDAGVYNRPVGIGFCFDTARWAEDIYDSLENLVKEIQKGVSKYKFTEFNFSFDHPDYLIGSFCQQKKGGEYLVKGNALCQERPLDLNEKKQFALAFLRLIAKKENEKVSVEKPTSILKIDRNQPFDPEAFMGKGWSIVEEDKRSLTLTEIDLNKVVLKTTLKENEKSVSGEERLRRLKEENGVRLDANCFKTLWENQKLIPESWKKKTNGSITYIFFDGTVLQDPHGLRYTLCLCWRGGGWGWGYGWLDSGWDADYPSALLAI